MVHNDPVYIVSSYVAMFQNVTPMLEEDLLCYSLSLIHFLWQQKFHLVCLPHSSSSPSFHYLPSFYGLPFLPCSSHLTLGVSLGQFPMSFTLRTVYDITSLFMHNILFCCWLFYIPNLSMNSLQFYFGIRKQIPVITATLLTYLHHGAESLLRS